MFYGLLRFPRGIPVVNFALMLTLLSKHYRTTRVQVMTDFITHLITAHDQGSCLAELYAVLARFLGLIHLAACLRKFNPTLRHPELL